jgi:hypothetical protein
MKFYAPHQTAQRTLKTIETTNKIGKKNCAKKCNDDECETKLYNNKQLIKMF